MCALNNHSPQLYPSFKDIQEELQAREFGITNIVEGSALATYQGSNPLRDGDYVEVRIECRGPRFWDLYAPPEFWANRIAFALEPSSRRGLVKMSRSGKPIYGKVRKLGLHVLEDGMRGILEPINLEPHRIRTGDVSLRPILKLAREYEVKGFQLLAYGMTDEEKTILGLSKAESRSYPFQSQKQYIEKKVGVR